jgi:hypothetical protein
MHLTLKCARVESPVRAASVRPRMVRARFSSGEKAEQKDVNMPQNQLEALQQISVIVADTGLDLDYDWLHGSYLLLIVIFSWQVDQIWSCPYDIFSKASEIKCSMMFCTLR